MLSDLMFSELMFSELMLWDLMFSELMVSKLMFSELMVSELMFFGLWHFVYWKIFAQYCMLHIFISSSCMLQAKIDSVDMLSWLFFSKEFFSCKYNAHHLFRLNMNEMRNENHKSSLQKMLQKNRNEMINEKSEIFTAENDPEKQEWNAKLKVWNLHSRKWSGKTGMKW